MEHSLWGQRLWRWRPWSEGPRNGGNQLPTGGPKVEGRREGVMLLLDLEELRKF